MKNSQIQQGSTHSKQTQSINISSTNDLRAFIELLTSKLSELELKADDQSEIEADIATLQAQLDSSRPKSSILHESLNSIKNILEGVAGSLIAQQLLPLIPPLLAAL